MKKSYLDRDYVCVVHVGEQHPGVLHQVALRRDKIKGELIRLGETAGDEFNGWRNLQDIDVVVCLAELVIEGDKTKVVPLEQNLAEMEYGITRAA